MPSESLSTLYQSAMPTPVPVPVPGVSVYPPQFTWAPQNTPTAESRAPAMVASALGGMKVLAGVAIGGAGMMRLGEMAGWNPPGWLTSLSRLDPMTAAMDAGITRYGAISEAAAAVGGRAGLAGVLRAGAVGVGTGILPAAAMYAAGTAFTNTLGGMRQQGALHHQMTGGFFNASAVSGRGYGARDLQMVGGMLRRIDRNDPFTSMADIGNITDSFGAMGMSQGLRDAEEGAKRLRTMVDTVRSMSRTLGASIQEATAVFGAIRSSGIYDRTGISSMGREMQTADVLGVGNQAFLGSISAGAGMSRNMGMTGAAGARLMSGTMRGLGLDVARGTLSSERLMDITGGSTLEEATSLMGQRLSGRALGVLSNTAVGKAILASVGAKKDGTYTGGVDQGALESLLNGGKLSDLSSMGYARMGNSKASKASFVTRQEDIMSSLAESGGGEDLLSLIGSLAMQQSGGDEDMAKVYLEHLGIQDRREAQLILEATKNRSARKREGVRKLRQTLSANEMRERQRLGLSRGAITTFAENITSPFQDLGASTYTAMSMGVEHIKDDLYGISRYNLTDSMYDDIGQEIVSGKIALPNEREGRAYIGSAGRLQQGIGRPIGAVMDAMTATNPLMYGMESLAGSLPSQRIASVGQISGERLDMALEIQQRGKVDAMRGMSAEDIASYQRIGASGGEGLSARGRLLADVVQRSGALAESGGVLDSASAATAAAFRLDIPAWARNTAAGYTKAIVNPTAALIGYRGTQTRRDAAALGSLPGGNILVQEALGRDITLTGGYETQEAAKSAMRDALSGLGFDSQEADKYASGGPTGELLRELSKLQESGVDTYDMLGRLVDGIKSTDGYANAVAQKSGEQYLSSQLAMALSKQLKRSVSPEAAAMVAKSVRGATAFGGTRDNREGWSGALKAGRGLANASALNERRQGLADSLRGDNASALASVAPEIYAGLSSAATTSSYSTLAGELSADKMSELLDRVSANRDVFRKGGATDRSLEEASAKREAARGMSSNAKILELYGIEKGSPRYDELMNQDKNTLINTLAGSSALQAIAAGGTGGTTMLRSMQDPVSRDEALARSMMQMSEVVASLHNKLVDGGTITGDKIHIPPAQGGLSGM